METRRPLFAFIPLLLLATTTVAQTAERTLAKSFNTSGAYEAFLNVPGEVVVKTWKSDAIRVQMIITLQDGNDTMLKTLITTKRYDLQSKNENGLLIIYAPNLEKEVQVAGKKVTENIRFIVNAPEKLTVRQREMLPDQEVSLAKEPGSK